MDDLKLGQIIRGEQQKDAVHIAVAPVTAAESLKPGQHVGVVGERIGSCLSPIGIVDPFLKEPVSVGQRFWLFLYPGSIKSLRHVWTHSAFKFQGMIGPSEAWLREFAETVGLTYQDLMEGTQEWIVRGNYLIRGGLLEGQRVPDEFWQHYQSVMGVVVEADKQESFFSCSC